MDQKSLLGSWADDARGPSFDDDYDLDPPYTHGISPLEPLEKYLESVYPTPPKPSMITYSLLRWFREKDKIQYRNDMVDRANSRCEDPFWLREYWAHHPYGSINTDVANVKKIDPSYRIFGQLPRKDFRLYMAHLMRDVDPRPGRSICRLLSRYWKVHPLSREDGDDDEIIETFRSTIAYRMGIGKPLIGTYDFGADVILPDDMRPELKRYYKFRMSMSKLTYTSEGNPTWLEDYWLNHPYNVGEAHIVGRPIRIRPPITPPDIPASFKEFRLRMASLLSVFEGKEEEEYKKAYWLNHPISEAEDPEIMHVVSGSIRNRHLQDMPLDNELLLSFPM